MLIDKKLIKEQSFYMFEEFLKNNKTYKSIAYFRRSPAGWLLMLKIMEYYHSDKQLFIEKLTNEIPYDVSSRQSIFTIIDSAAKNGFLEKKSTNSDGRKKEIVPSQSFIDEYKEWLMSITSQLGYKKKNGKEQKQSNTD
jgi:hypothetical protein